MKKTLIFAIMAIMIAFSGTVSAQTTETYTKELSDRFRSVETKLQFFLSGELTLSVPKTDTIISYTKKGRPIETIVDKTITRVIRTNELGVVTKREGNVIYVTFDEKKKTEMTLPFILSGDGAQNAYVLKLNEAFGGGATNEITINGKDYVVDNTGINLDVYSPKLKENNKTEKLISSGKKVKN